MIKFFRKIRQDLLSTGKTGKYFKYAIGEIVLVVIGILIALQINNWNERKNQEKIVKSLFIEVQKDLLNDIEEADLIIDWYENIDTIAQNVYNGKYENEDYKNSTDNNLFIVGTLFYPFKISNQSFEVLNGKKDFIPVRYKELLNNLNSIYKEQADILDIRQSAAIKQSNDYYKYLHNNYDWMISFKNNIFSDEMIDYHLNNKNHKRQVLLWNDYTRRVYLRISSIKNDAITNSIIIHNLFTPEKELPETLSKIPYNFIQNNSNDYIGYYKSESENIDYQIYTKYGLLYWGNFGKSNIHGQDVALTEFGKDSLGFAVNKNYLLLMKRDTTGKVIGIEGSISNKKVIEFEKFDSD